MLFFSHSHNWSIGRINYEEVVSTSDGVKIFLAVVVVVVVVVVF